MFVQAISILGAALVLGAFAAHQARWLAMDTHSYQLMNFFGGVFLFVAALESGQPGLIAIEGSWALVSAWGEVRLIRARTR
jgi:hypothetical protein